MTERKKKIDTRLTRSRRADGEATRARIVDAARALFRKKGFDATTMREIATEAGTSLGLAYHYFPSKESIALALFETHIARHEARATSAIAEHEGLAERLRVALESSLEVRTQDREVLRVLARVVLDVDNPAWLFADGTRSLRERSIGVFRDVVRTEDVPDDVRESLALALWAMHLGILLRFVNDRSRGQAQTHALVDGAVDLVPPAVTLLGSALLAPVRARLTKAFVEAGLLPLIDATLRDDA